VIERMVDFDTALFALINTRMTAPVLDRVMPFITEQEHWYPILAALLLAMVIWGGKRGRMAAVAFIIAVALSDQVTCAALKPLVGRVRPCNALPVDEVRLLVGRSSAFSFPSAHASNSFAMATVVSWRYPRAAFLCFLIAAAVAYSRVYVGLHYPLDAVAGAIIGALLGRLAVWVVVATRDRIDSWKAARSTTGAA
jgi:undecaprenyl-diphosphatase